MTTKSTSPFLPGSLGSLGPLGRFRRLRPGAESFWIDWAPTRWSGPLGRPWLDLATGVLHGPFPGAVPGATSRPEAPKAKAPSPESPSPMPSEGTGSGLDRQGIAVAPVDLELLGGSFGEANQSAPIVYLPPTSAVSPGVTPTAQLSGAGSWLGSLAELRRGGARVLVQDTEDGVLDQEADLLLFDLSPLLLQDDISLAWPDRVAAFFAQGRRQQALNRAEALVWPVIAAISEEPEQVRALLEACPAKTPRRLLFVLPKLDAATKRWLAATRSEAVFDALFHGPNPSERALASVARGAGWEVWWPRPVSATAPQQARGRREEIAGRLLAAGDLLLRSGETVRGHTLLRAARWTEESSWDLSALDRDGNLDVLPWLDDEARLLVREWARGGTTPAFERLVADFASAVGAPDLQRSSLDSAGAAPRSTREKSLHDADAESVSSGQSEELSGPAEKETP